MRKAGRWAVRVLAAIGFVFILATVTPIDDWWIARLAGEWNSPKGDVLVVLGADSMQDVIGLSSYWRSVYAVRAYRAGGFHKLVVSGGSRNSAVSVAQRMRDFMVSQGIPAAAISVEGESGSTRENALKSKPILDALPGRKILMTSDYHMFRANRVFQKAAIAVEPSPLPDAAKQTGSLKNRWPVFLTLCQETAKIAYYFVRGWI